MAKSDAYHKLVYELGDQARDRLAENDPPLPAMNLVFQAEDVVMARRGELDEIEARLNEADSDLRAQLEQDAQERVRLQEVVKKYRKAVDAIEGRVKDLRKKLAAARAENQLNRDGLKLMEARQADLEMSQPDPMKLEQGRNMLKRLRVQVLRKEREIGEMDAELTQALTPEPGKPGGAGIEAHRKLIQMEDELAARKQQASEEMAKLDKAMAEKEAELEDAEADLADALFLLGEECYAKRINDEVLAPLYVRIDRVR